MNLDLAAKYEFDTTPAHLRFPTDDKLMLDFVARGSPGKGGDENRRGGGVQ